MKMRSQKVINKNNGSKSKSLTFNTKNCLHYGMLILSSSYYQNIFVEF
jgi:hypothetical protein